MGRAPRGYVAMLLIAVLGTAAATWFVTALGTNQMRNEREKKTAAALGLAKQALVGDAERRLAPWRLGRDERAQEFEKHVARRAVAGA